jgi:hypothetical protein
VEITEEEPTEIEEPDPETDAIVYCVNGMRFTASLEGTFLGTRNNEDEAWEEIRVACGKDFRPSCWFVDDHGGFEARPFPEEKRS